MNLSVLFTIICVLLGAASVFAEDRPAIIQVSKAGEPENATEGAARADDDIRVVLRGFGAWLAEQVDSGYFDEDPAIKAATHMPGISIPGNVPNAAGTGATGSLVTGNTITGGAIVGAAATGATGTSSTTAGITGAAATGPATNGPAAVAWIVKNRRLQRVLKQFAEAQDATGGDPLTEEQWKAEWAKVSKDQVDLWIKPGSGSAIELAQNFRSFFVSFVRAKLAELTLCMDGEVLTGVHPSNLGLGSGLENWKSLREGTQSLKFSLRQISRPSDSWKRLTSVPKFAKRVRVSLALRGGATQLELPTLVDPSEKDGFEFALNLIPIRRFVLAAALFLAMAWLLVHLARTRDLLRDPDEGWRPDGRRAFSLSRLQMAIWTLVVVGTFLFLWVVTSQTDTVNSTALALVGIGAGTLLGASVIGDFAKQKTGPYPFSYAVDEPDEKFLEALDKEIARVTQIEANEQDPAKKAELQWHIGALNAQRSKYEAHYRKLSPTARVMQDLLCEENIYSFHRYQMLLWTVSLVIVFIVTVAVDLVMPTFNETLLALVGISSGLYVGFKWRDVQKSNAPSGQ